MSPNWKLRGRWGEQINNFSKQDYCCCICQGQDAWAPVSKYGTTNSGGEAKLVFTGDAQKLPERGLLGGQRGTSSVHKITADREAC